MTMHHHFDHSLSGRVCCQQGYPHSLSAEVPDCVFPRGCPFLSSREWRDQKYSRCAVLGLQKDVSFSQPQRNHSIAKWLENTAIIIGLLDEQWLMVDLQSLQQENKCGTASCVLQIHSWKACQTITALFGNYNTSHFHWGDWMEWHRGTVPGSEGLPLGRWVFGATHHFVHLQEFLLWKLRAQFLASKNPLAGGGTAGPNRQRCPPNAESFSGAHAIFFPSESDLFCR